MAGKAQIVDQLVAGGATRAQAAAAVDAVLDAITASLAAGERVTLTGFGTFEPTGRSARTARNPRTGDSAEVAATTVARFRPGTALRTAVATGSAGGAVVRPALGSLTAGGGGSGGASDATGTSPGKAEGKGRSTGKGQANGKERDDPEGGKHGPAATGEPPAGAASVVTRSAGEAGKASKAEKAGKAEKADKGGKAGKKASAAAAQGERAGGAAVAQPTTTGKAGGKTGKAGGKGGAKAEDARRDKTQGKAKGKGKKDVAAAKSGKKRAKK